MEYKEKRKKIYLNVNKLSSNYSSINQIRYNSIAKEPTKNNYMQLRVKRQVRDEMPPLVTLKYKGATMRCQF